jgi:hypothetical protein
MNEATMKRALVERIRERMPGAVVWRLEDKFTAGRPDIAIVWRGRFAGVEVKLDRAKRKGERTELQKLTLRRLESAGALGVWLVYWPDGAIVIERWDTSPLAHFDGPRPAHGKAAEWLASWFES